MAKLFSIGLRLLVVLLIIAVLDGGCLYRDPGVELPGGYEISAISPGSPCSLYQSMSARPPLELQRESQDVDPKELDSSHAAEQAAVWAPEAGDSNALPPEKPRLHWCPPFQLEGVTGFNADDQCIIGTYDGGYYLLHLHNGLLETWSSSTPWSRAVARETSLSPDEMKNPKSRWLQTREPVAYAIYAGIFLVGLPWALAPLFRGKHTKTDQLKNRARNDP